MSVVSSISGINYPYIFSSKRGRTSTVSGKDKARADINLLLRSQRGEMLFNPTVGIDFDSLMFIEDRRAIQRIITDYVQGAIEGIEGVSLEDVSLVVDGVKLSVNLTFIYMKQKKISMFYTLGDLLYEQ